MDNNIYLMPLSLFNAGHILKTHYIKENNKIKYWNVVFVYKLNHFLHYRGLSGHSNLGM